jgi:hypothetical protein
MEVIDGTGICDIQFDFDEFSRVAICDKKWSA